MTTDQLAELRRLMNTNFVAILKDGGKASSAADHLQALLALADLAPALLAAAEEGVRLREQVLLMARNEERIAELSAALTRARAAAMEEAAVIVRATIVAKLGEQYGDQIAGCYIDDCIAAIRTAAAKGGT